jgi:hypothetical protein
MLRSARSSVPLFVRENVPVMPNQTVMQRHVIVTARQLELVSILKSLNFFSSGCKEDECKDFCSKHSGGRVFKSTCMKSTVCKCNLGDPSDPSDPSKENMNIMEYPLTGDYRAEVRILPK